MRLLIILACLAKACEIISSRQGIHVPVVAQTLQSSFGQGMLSCSTGRDGIAKDERQRIFILISLSYGCPTSAGSCDSVHQQGQFIDIAHIHKDLL
jgi:hypothetical protein